MPSRDVWHLHPALRELVAEWARRCAAEGLDILITCTYRSNEEQAQLYAEGRTESGRIKTWAKPGQSKHNLTAPDGTPAAEAFDFVPMRNGKCVWGLAAAEDRGLWTRCVAIARELGLRCGADWPVRKRDWPHLELKRCGDLPREAGSSDPLRDDRADRTATDWVAGHLAAARQPEQQRARGVTAHPEPAFHPRRTAAEAGDRRVRTLPHHLQLALGQEVFELQRRRLRPS